MADARVERTGPQKGRRTPAGEKSVPVVVGQLRRWLGSVAVQSRARLLLDRMDQVGDGVGEAVCRRRKRKQQEEKQAVEEKRIRLSQRPEGGRCRGSLD